MKKYTKKCAVSSWLLPCCLAAAMTRWTWLIRMRLTRPTSFTNLNDLELSLISVYSSMKTYDMFGADLLPKVYYGLPKTADQDWLGTGG